MKYGNRFLVDPQESEKPRIAVCGAGFIGRSLLDRLNRLGHAARVLDRNAPDSTIAASTEWVTADFTDAASVAEVLSGCRVAFHLVGSTVPGDDITAMVAAFDAETAAMAAFVAACARAGVRRIVLSSSAAVYGDQRSLPVAESATPAPISGYGRLKVELERTLLKAACKHDIDVVILRIANPYGPRQRTDGRQGFIGLVIGRMLRGEPVDLRGHGDTIRDFVYIEDVVQAMLLAASSPVGSGIYNIASGVGTTLAEVLDILESISGKVIARRYLPTRDEDIPRSILDIDLARGELGYEVCVPLAAGLELMLRHHGLI